VRTLPDPRERPWLTVAELAEWTGEGEKAIRAAIDAGQLPRLNIGRYVRIPTALLAVQLGIAPTHADAGPSTEPAPDATSSSPKEVSHDHGDPPTLPQSSNVRALHP
jgi:excisionase family DNA binding protein